MTLYWNVIFYLDPTDTLSLYIRIVKLDLLGCVIFHLDPIEPSVKLKKIIRNQDRLGTSELYNPTNPERSQRSLKDPNRFGLVGP